MEKKRVSVQIEGRNYVVITTEDRAYVHGVADEVTDRIRNAAQTGRNLDTRDCAVLAALDFCADANGDGKLSIRDVTQIQRILAGFV